MDLSIGSIVMFDGITPPIGWFDCDGSAHNGITTPNLVGFFPKGVGVWGSLGETGGSTMHVHSNTNTESSTHGHGATSSNSGMSVDDVGNIWDGNSYGLSTHQHLVSISAVSGAAPHTHPIPNTDASSTLPPNISLRFIMRCA